jgi:peptide/nickel transport system permease protein
MTTGATDGPSGLDPRPPRGDVDRVAPTGGGVTPAAARRLLSPLLRFLLIRTLLLLIVVLAAASLMMLLTSLAPGDAADELSGPGVSRRMTEMERAELGLDRPLAERYVRWLGRVIRLDLGRSTKYRQPVADLVAARAANTAILALAALIVATLAGLPLGVLAGCGRWPWLTSLVSGASVLALSLPPLLTSLVFALIAVRTGWLPVGGMSSVDADSLALTDRLVDALRHMLLPTLALALPLAATLERLQAAAVEGGRHERHVLAARGLGLPFSRVLVRDLWRPTIAPVAGLVGLAAGTLLSGSLAVEMVTSWPGLGRLMFEALTARDVALAAGCAAAAAAFLSVWSALSDLIVWQLDPRTRPEHEW